MSTDTIRSWRAALLRDGRSEDRTVKAYRLVGAILNTAVDDVRSTRNHGRHKGGGADVEPESDVARDFVGGLPAGPGGAEGSLGESALVDADARSDLDANA